MEQIKIKDGFRGERSLVLPEMIRRIEEDDTVLRQLYITDLGFYPHATHHYRQRTTPINQYVLIYCISGSGYYQVEDRHYEVKANQFFILPALKPHAYASNNDDPWTIYWIHFSGFLASYYTPPTEAPITVSPNLNSRIADRNAIFEDMFITLSDGFTTENLRYTSSLLHFYLGSLQYLPIYRKCHKKAEQDITNEEQMITNAALQFMEENLEKNLSLQQLADYTGYSPSHFSMIFKKHVGHSPLSYFNLLKIKKACCLLETTEMKINQISSMTGFGDALYFSRLFTKTIGVSPKKYREKTSKQ